MEVVELSFVQNRLHRGLHDHRHRRCIRSSSHPRPKTLESFAAVPDFDAGSLQRSVKDELRTNLLRAHRTERHLSSPACTGTSDTVGTPKS